MNKLAFKRLRIGVLPVAAAALAACASAPTTNAKLDEARTAYQKAASDTLVARSAQLELQRAQQALQKSEAALRAGDDISAVEHYAYLARQQAAVALQAGNIARAEMAVSDAQAQRDRILIEARTRDAESRRAEAERARTEADNARRLAEERLAAERATRTKLSKLQSQFDELKAKPTDRGMVLTLGDVLFDTGRAELKPGAMPTIDRLATFMRENPDRRLSVEGHTDAVGSEELNLLLSQQRAERVRMALVVRGIDGARIATRGFGEANPVASNGTPEGRQRNRRIEIIISSAS